MSRTARCLLALGFSVTLAAACGDDDGGINAVGGGAGAGGTSGSGGTAGRGGSAGTAGTAGRGGSAGTAGRGGTAGTGNGGTSPGTGGTSAGTGGTSAGTGGTGEIPDGGADDASVPDSGSVVVVDAAAPDSGTNGDCPANLETDLSDDLDPVNDQQIAIARVFFRTNGGATVVLKNVSNATFDFSDTSFLCSGGLNTCLATNGLPDLGAGAEQTITFIDDTAADGGELALLLSGGTAALAYVAWDDGITDYVSQEVTADFDDDANTADTDTADDLETIAIASGNGRWTEDERATVLPGQNTLFGDDDPADTEEGFSACTGDGDFSGQ